MFRNKNLSSEAALNRAAAYCSQAERCPTDVHDKLLKWGVSEGEAEAIVRRLTDENFLSEERYIHAFIHDKLTYERWGRVKILFTLRGKHLDENLIDRQLESGIDEEAYTRTLTDLLRAKLRGMAVPLSREDRARIYRFAAQKGFESRYVARALQAAHLSTDEDDDAYVPDSE